MPECRIDHAAPLAVPAALCRVCSPVCDGPEQEKPAGCNHWPGQLRCGVCGMEKEPWPFKVRPDNCTPADVAVMHELAGKQAALDAVKDYEKQKQLAALEQWRHENPELAKMEAKAKRDARRRVAKLGLKPTGRHVARKPRTRSKSK